MASWNSQVRGNVIAIKNGCGWDPTQIVDATNPMPSESNQPGLGTFQPGTDDEATTFGSPAMDAPQKGGAYKGKDPYAGMGDF